MEEGEELEQFISSRLSDVHLVNLAGAEQSDSSDSDDYGDVEDYKPLLTYSKPPRGPQQQTRRKRDTPSLFRRLAAIKWRNIFMVATAVFDYFLVYTAISLIGTFFPTQAIDKGASSIETGIIIGIASLTLTIFAPVVGYFLPKLGIKFSMITGLLIVGGTYLTLGATIYLPSGWPFIVVCSVLRFTEGVGTALYNTAAYTLVNKLYPESVGFVMGVMEIGSGVGYASGPVIGGYLYLVGGYKLPFFVIGGLCILFTIPTFLLLKSTSGNSQLLNIQMVIKLMSNFVLVLLLLSTILQMAGLGFTVGTLAIFLEDQFNLTPDKVGLVFLSSSVFYVLSAPVAGKIADKINPRWLIVNGLFLSGVGFLFIGPAYFLTVSPVLWLTGVALGIIGTGSGSGLVAVFPDFFTIAMSAFPPSNTEDMDALSGVVAGLISGGMSFGEFLGPVIGGGLTHFLTFQDSASLYGEVLLALMVLILAVSLVDRCFSVGGLMHKESPKFVNLHTDEDSPDSGSTTASSSRTTLTPEDNDQTEDN